MNKKITRNLIKNGNENNIIEIIDVLNKYGFDVQKVLNSCLSIYAFGKAREIDKKITIAKENEVDFKLKKNINIILMYPLKKFENIFSCCNIEIKKYLILKGYYNKVLTKEIIEDIMYYKQCDVNDIIFQTMNISKTIGELIYRNYLNKDSIYIGKSCHISKHHLNKYAALIVEISKIIPACIKVKYKHIDKSEIQSEALNIIIEKCGNVIYNVEVDEQIMKKCIINKVIKYLKHTLYKSSNINFQETYTKSCEDSYAYENELDLSTWDVNKYEEELLKMISDKLQKGYSLKESVNIIALDLKVKEEDIYESIKTIKNKKQNIKRYKNC